MDGAELRRRDGTHLVHRLAQHVQHAAQRLLAHRHGNRCAQAQRIHAAHQAVGRIQRNRTHAAFAQVLRDFANNVDRLRRGEPFAGDADGRQDNRHLAFGELNIDGGSGDLNDLANDLRGGCCTRHK